MICCFQRLTVNGKLCVEVFYKCLTRENNQLTNLKMEGSCIFKDWEPPLKELADDEEGVSTYPMLLGKKDGVLEILL